MQERRLFPRYTLCRPVGVIGADGERFEAESSEISMAGVGLLMDRPAVVALAQGGAILTAGDRLRLRLPRPGKGRSPLDFELNGQVRLVRRLSQHRYVAVVLFAHSSDTDQAALSALVDEAKGAPIG